jgi:hypothetical protein
MGLRIARVTFTDGTEMYTPYTTVSDQCHRELLPATAAEASWLMSADTQEDSDQRLDSVCRKHTGMSWDEYQRAMPNPDDTSLPSDVEEVHITVPNYNDEGWASRASKGTRLVVGPTSLECSAEETALQGRRQMEAARAVPSQRRQQARLCTLRGFFNRLKQRVGK